MFCVLERKASWRIVCKEVSTFETKALKYTFRRKNIDSSPLDKIAAISQTIYSDAFMWMKNYIFFIKNSPKFIPKGPTDNNLALV